MQPPPVPLPPSEQALSKNEWDSPLAHTHFKAEGDVEFKAVLFVPTYAPPGASPCFCPLPGSRPMLQSSLATVRAPTPLRGICRQLALCARHSPPLPSPHTNEPFAKYFMQTCTRTTTARSPP